MQRKMDSIAEGTTQWMPIVVANAAHAVVVQDEVLVEEEDLPGAVDAANDLRIGAVALLHREETSVRVD